MSAYKLRWFSLGGLLGLLGIVLHEPMLYALFSLFVFTPFFWVDERAEVNLVEAQYSVKGAGAHPAAATARSFAKTVS